MIGNGVHIEVSTSSPTSYTEIGQILELDEISLIRAVVDGTYHGHTYKRPEPGMLEWQPLSFTLLHKSGSGENSDSVYDELVTGDWYWIRVRFPDTENSATQDEAYEFQGFFSKLGVTVPREDEITSAVELQIDGNTLAKYDPASY